MRTFVRRYGAHPLHLIVLVGCFALAGYAALGLISEHAIAVVVWFVGAAVLHDLVLVPLYAVIDGGLRRVRSRPGELPRVPWLNYVRFPAVISGILLLVFLPSIAQLSGIYHATTGLSASGYFLRWLAVTGVLFLLSGIAFAFRLRRSR
jgi:hypothetical protein